LDITPSLTSARALHIELQERHIRAFGVDLLRSSVVWKNPALLRGLQVGTEGAFNRFELHFIKFGKHWPCFTVHRSHVQLLHDATGFGLISILTAAESCRSPLRRAPGRRPAEAIFEGINLAARLERRLDAISGAPEHNHGRSRPR